MGWLLLFYFLWIVADHSYRDCLNRGTFKYYSYELFSDLIYFGFWIVEGIVISFDVITFLGLTFFLILTVYHFTMAIQKRPKIEA